MVWSKPKRGKKGEKNDVKRDRRVNKQSSSQSQRKHAGTMTPERERRRERER